MPCSLSKIIVEGLCHDSLLEGATLIFLRYILGFVVLPITLSLGCNQDTEENPQETAKDIRVEVVSVQKKSFRETVRGIGTLRARETVEISPEMAGILRDTHFEEGQPVKRGDLLFTIDDSKLNRQLRERNAALEEAKARMEKAEKTAERISKLYKRHTVSEERWDQAVTEVEAARAEVNRLSAALELTRERFKDTRIRAPFRGVVSKRHVDPGDYVRRGEVMVTLYDTENMEAEVKIPERHMHRVQSEQKAELRIPAFPESVFSGRVRFVSPAVAEHTRDFLVKVSVENSERKLKPGTFAGVTLITAVRESRPAVPEEALVATREGYIVFVVENGKARRRTVRIGQRDAGMVEIREGARVGDIVVRTGHMRLSDGDRVSIQ
ncbi:MAG: efflux RND transporter periplasmic adaptor subunit [Desulfatiglandaceae bacterium]